MLQCFLDESGKGNGPVMVIAGWIAEAETWTMFDADWRQFLAGPPSLAYFKMKEAHRGNGAFWSTREEEARRARVAIAQSVITDHVRAGVSITVPTEAYERIFGAIPVWKDPYVFMLFQLIKSYKRDCGQLGLSREISFYFDKQEKAEGRIDEAWDFFEASGNERLLELMGDRPEFRDDKTSLPLQAADLMAWWIRRQLADHHEGVQPPPFPWSKPDTIPSLAIRYSERDLRRDYVTMFETPKNKEILFRLGMWP